MEVLGRFHGDVLDCAMLYRFGEFELDARKVELRRAQSLVALEPQVFALLFLLVENAERMISKDEIVEKVWDGRIVSDSAIASRVKAARRALGDDGTNQRFIRTVHGKGFRFVATVSMAPPAQAAEPARVEPQDAPAQASDPAKPSIAVLPFRPLGMLGSHVAIADAIPHDLIAALSRLRWLFVIARGSSFRFRSPDRDVRHVGSTLNARYCLSGVVEIFGGSISVTVELADCRTGGVVWGDNFKGHVDDIHLIRSEIVTNVISALEIQIPLNEAQTARLKAPENLDAWGAFHVGLQHMYRFNRRDNAAATAMFEKAIAKDPGFARAHAGLSFTHFQDAFLRYSDDQDAEVDKARRFAERSLELDPLDPFANFTMGRAFWLNGDLESSLAWLERATSINPNFAQGFYARGWADTICEKSAIGVDHVDLSITLSPLDPLLFAMRATKALACIVAGDHEKAAELADEAARTPGAHVLIHLIAVVAHALVDDGDKAAIWAAEAHRRRPDLAQNLYFRSFPFQDGEVRTRMSEALTRHGF